ncbi:hypothetical protein LAH08_01558 [Micromonospora noduli]|nr:hypothetical protein LAH08_01558 [Micromonospora noduli]
MALEAHQNHVAGLDCAIDGRTISDAHLVDQSERPIPWRGGA